MAKQQEDAVVNVVINGDKAISSFRELNALRREQQRLVEGLNRNKPEYAQQKQRLDELNAAHRVWRQEIYGNTAAINKLNNEMEQTGKGGWFDRMKSMFGPGSLMVAGGNLIAGGLQTAWSALSSFVSGSEEGYIESIKNQAQLAQAIKSTGGVAGRTKEQLNDLAMQIRENTGVDDEFVGKGESILLTFTNIRGKIYDEALPAIVDYAAALGQGEVTMESMQAASTQVGKALNDPIKGVTALAKVGVTFTAQQKEQIQTLVDSNRMMDAQAIVLRELQKEFGGVAKAVGDTDEGQMKKYQLRIDDIQDKIGKWITKGKLLILEFIQPAVKWIGELFDRIDSGSVQSEKARAIFAQIGKLLSDLWAIVKPLGKAIGDAFTNTSALDLFRNMLANIVIPLKTIALVIKDLREGKFAQAVADGSSGLIAWQRNTLEMVKNTYGVAKDLTVNLLKSTDAITTNLQNNRKKLAEGGSKTTTVEGNGKVPGSGVPEAPTNGGETAADRKKAQQAKEKRAKELADFQKQLIDAQREVDAFLNDATKGTSDNLDAQLKVIDNKYQKLIDRLKELNGNKDALKDKNGNLPNDAAIANLEAARNNEEASTRATFSYGLAEKTINDDAAQKLQNKKDLLAEELITEEEFAASEFAIEQRRLSDLYDVRELFGMQTLDLEDKLANDRIKNNKREYDTRMKQIREQSKLEQDYIKVKQQIETEKANLANAGIQILEAVFGRSKELMFAQLAVEKAVAIGRVLSNLGIEIAGYYANPASIFTFGAAAVPAATAATLRANLSIAGIVASGIAQGIGIAKSDTGNKKYAQGGILPNGPSHSAGGLKLVDPYGMVFGEVEGGEPILSRQTYANNRSLVNALLNSGGQQLNMERINSALTAREQRTSAPVAQNSAAAQNASTGEIVSVVSDDLMRIFNILTSKMDNMAGSFADQRIILSNRYFEESATKTAQIRNNANA